MCRCCSQTLVFPPPPLPLRHTSPPSLLLPVTKHRHKPMGTPPRASFSLSLFPPPPTPPFLPPFLALAHSLSPLLSRAFFFLSLSLSLSLSLALKRTDSRTCCGYICRKSEKERGGGRERERERECMCERESAREREKERGGREGE